MVDGVDDVLALLFFFVDESVLFVEGGGVGEVGVGHVYMGFLKGVGFVN